MRTLDAEALSLSGLVAAARWLDELSKRSLSSAAVVLRGAPQYRGLTPTQYRVGFEWLVAVGIVSADGEVLVPVDSPASTVLEAHLLLSPPTWLPDADVLVQSERDIPIDLADIAASLGLTDGEAFVTMSRAHIKFDDHRRREIGLAGELAFADWLQAQCVETVIHVSQYDDSAGFDLSVGEDPKAHIEVKTTLKHGDFTVFLSRNEFRVMLRDPHWCLQVVRLSPNDETTISAIGWLRSKDLEAWAPRDAQRGRWESFKVRVFESDLQPGLSPVVAAVTG